MVSLPRDVVIGRPGAGEMRIMFLGGTADHTIRVVPVSDDDPNRPKAETIKMARPLEPKIGKTEPTVEILTDDYALWRSVSGPWVWWTYVLVGYDPPRRHFLDANPHPYYKA